MDDQVVLDFPYDAGQVAEVKAIPGAKWDRVARVWRVPATHLGEARAFAVKHGFTLHPDVELFDVPERPAGPHVDVVKSGFLLLFPFDPVKVKAARDIPGATWDAVKGGWHVPSYSLGQVVEFADRFGLTVPDTLRGRQGDVLERQQRLLVMSAAHDADVEMPAVHGELLPFQRAGVAYALETRRLLMADQQGLGKTVEALVALEVSAAQGLPAYPCLIVCPPKLTLNWQYEIGRWLPHRDVLTIRDRKTFPDWKADFTVIGYSNIDHWKERLKGFTSVILDESHAIKNYTAARTKAAIKIVKSADPQGMVMLLTGTPITNRPAEYAAQIDALGRLGDFGGRWGLYKRYANAFQDRFGHWHIDGHANLDELNVRLRSSYYLRRTKDEVMPQLAPIRHVRLMVEPDEKLMVEYRQAERDIATYMADRAAHLAVVLGQSPMSAAVRARMKAESAQFLVRISALRRLAALAKLDSVKEWVDNLVEQGEKVVIAAHHRDVVDKLASYWGGLKIQGGMPVTEVEAAKKRFQEGTVEDSPVIVLSIQAAGTGHTLTAAQNILLVELPWTPADVSQVIARLHRIGQEGSVLATYMLAEGTIDEDIMDMLDAKERIVNAATEGDRTGQADMSGLLMKMVRMGLDEAGTG